MKNKALVVVLFVFGMFVSTQYGKTQTGNQTQIPDTLKVPAQEKLAIVWTSGDREVALKMVFMYTFNAKRFGWWDDLTLVVWGPSAKTLSEDQELQEEIKKIIDTGIVVKACKGCADQYGVSEKLEELGVVVLYIGKELTDYIKEGRRILTF